MANELFKAFKASDLLDKNINFLIGSGASASYIPTLRINDDKTYEDILTDSDYSEILNYVYHQYYKNILRKSFCLVPLGSLSRKKRRETLTSYEELIENIVSLINRKGANQIRRANIFTTNYDLFFEKASDRLLRKSANFIFNDGARGLSKRYLQISNFHTSTWHQGTNDLYKFEIPTINLIKMHGSVSWKKISEDKIEVNYPSDYPNGLELEITTNDIKETVNNIEEHSSKYTAEEILSLSSEDESALQNFREEYNKLAIVNPTKAKFEETVFQQHYYQSLRLLSYELEKPQTVLVCFGFSFKDEHIREIISRSLSNPSLIVYIFCYKKDDKAEIKKLVSNKKIIFIHPDNDDSENVINIDRFINCIFPTIGKDSTEGLVCSL
ncbi:SIR2 family protein [Buttiauxella selenatireducens]|uniref:SIR2 family protein n=1 Tax=Buttiauxella selenatireducens TaxID=3073902 RepID=A0ABY9SEE5_9ENTR|nr:SIR2 family protein [Buttiauxella sp. R73]WMY75338.1 SIR2 family protein [Buttiauxella sp. R73]